MDDDSSRLDCSHIPIFQRLSTSNTKFDEVMGETEIPTETVNEEDHNNTYVNQNPVTKD